MPSMLSDNEKLTVKRTVPKAANKIHAVAVAKLYIAYPNRQKWTYTGLQGAAVLADDLVGNTFWIKLVDVSVWTISAQALRAQIADMFSVIQSRRYMGSGNLRHIRIQPRSNILSQLRTRGLYGGAVF